MSAVLTTLPQGYAIEVDSAHKWATVTVYEAGHVMGYFFSEREARNWIERRERFKATRQMATA